MGQRKNTKPRCGTCGLHEELCACASMPRLRTRYPLVLVQNNHERNKPTNTGRLLTHVLEDCALTRYAVRGEAFDATPLEAEDADYHLLFPGPSASVLTSDLVAPRPGRRSVLVVLDGTWGQCGRMRRRIPALAGMPCFALPEGPPSHWHGIREQPDPGRVCTFEAVIRMLAITDGPSVAEPMSRWFDQVAARALFMRGKLRSPEVPETWPTAFGRETRGGPSEGVVGGPKSP